MGEALLAALKGGAGPATLAPLLATADPSWPVGPTRVSPLGRPTLAARLFAMPALPLQRVA